MAIASVGKVGIAVHSSQREELLRRLQEEGILHISEAARKDEKEGEGEEQEEGIGEASQELKQTLARLNQAMGFLKKFSEEQGGGLFGKKPSLPAAEFRQRVKELNLSEKLEKVEELGGKSSELDAGEKEIKGEIQTLEPWKKLKHPPQDYTELSRTGARFIFILDKEERKTLLSELKGLSTNLTKVKAEEKGEYALLLFHKGEEKDVDQALKTAGIKEINLEGFTAPPKKGIETRKKRLDEIASEREELAGQARKIAEEIMGFQTASDMFENEMLLRQEHTKFANTRTASLIEGWVRKADRKRLEEITSEFEASEVVSLRAGKGEEPPVALRNPQPFKPFELILNLYGTPNPREADPSPLLAPFFALFFALCVTDAGYGIVLTAVTAFLIWGQKVRNDLIWILFYGGILTIFTGAATGSWFGNMPEMLEISALSAFRDSLTWFDPIKNPMPFFYISLGVGYFQMMFGIGVAVVDGLRTGEYASALFDSLPWFVIFLGVPLAIAVSVTDMPPVFKTVILLGVIAAIGVSVVLSHRPGRTSVTSAILMWALVTASLAALAKGTGLLDAPGTLLKALVVGTAATLWLYTLFKGLSEKNLKPVGIGAGVLSLGILIVYVSGVLATNLFLALVALLSLVFALTVLEGWGSRIVWGTYKVYSSVTGVLGVVLSYVRLMALGMVTAGIAIAFNQIAWMLGGIPVVSVILILLVLVVGHVYNLLMSGLSGFVHTLRLQYVEFFPQFFTGGGQRFTPFELKTRFVNVTRRN